MKIPSRTLVVAAASLFAVQAALLVACSSAGQTNLTPPSRADVSPDTPHKFA